MALIFNSWSWKPLLQSHSLLCSLIVLVVVFLLLLTDHHATALTFNLSNIVSNQIQVYGDAFVDIEGIQLTTSKRNQARNSEAGRAMYYQLLNLWDQKSGKMADFDTHFSFVINSNGNNTHYGDGLAFVLAHNDSFPLNSSIPIGGVLGLPFNLTEFRNTTSFVAVEFDTFYDGFWEPSHNLIKPGGTHVGIDINSINSSATKPWYSNISAGIENQAWISYNSGSKILSVNFTDNRNNVTSVSSLNFTIDMREYLPEWVAVGFSASTGKNYESHTVQSWRFNSTVLIDNTNNNKVILVVGLTIGSFVLVGGLALLGFHLWKTSRKKEEDGFEIKMCMDDKFETGRGRRRFHTAN